MSSLSTLSDGSDSSLNTGINLVLEEIGLIPALEAVSPKSLRSSGNYISILSEESHVFLAEVRLRADSDCLASRYTFLELPGIEEKKR